MDRINYKLMRERLLLSQDELAHAVGVDKMTVSRWERGIARPGRRNREKLKNVLMRGGNITQHPILLIAQKLPCAYTVTDLLTGRVLADADPTNMSGRADCSAVGWDGLKLLTESSIQTLEEMSGGNGFLEREIVSFEYAYRSEIDGSPILNSNNIIHQPGYSPVIMTVRTPITDLVDDEDFKTLTIHTADGMIVKVPRKLD